MALVINNRFGEGSASGVEVELSRKDLPRKGIRGRNGESGIDLLLIFINSLEENTDPREGTVRNTGLHFALQNKHQMSLLLDVPKFRYIPKRISRHSVIM